MDLSTSARAGAETLTCQLCGYLSPTLRIHISHLRQVHSKDDRFSVICGIQQCRQRFSTFGAYNSHVYRMHRSSLGLSVHEAVGEQNSSEAELEVTPSENPTPEEVYPGPTYQFENDDPPEELQYDIWHLLGVDKDQQQKEAATFLLKLKEVCNVSERTVSEVIAGYQGLLKNTLAVAKATVKDTLVNAGVCVADIAGLDAAFANVQDVFQGLETTYLQEKYFRDRFNVVEPIEIPFDNPYVNRFSGAKRQKVQSIRSFMYIPLFDSLAQLLQNKEVLREIHAVRASDSILKDYSDGSLCKNHPLIAEDNRALQIIAYFDELEVTNPVGSYVKTHKLGCLFFTLGNIRPQYRSSLKAIFLLGVALQQDIDRYGIDAFLKPFVEDLKRLYVDGISISIDSKASTYYGALIAFLADTQAAHKVGGFKGSVSFAHRICRSCMATRDDTQSLFDESQFELRSPEQHEMQCQSLVGVNFHNNSVKYGINRTSVLEEVPGFSVATGLPHDIMHDLFEGVVHYELKLFLRYCTFEKKFFTVETLNSRLQGYDFGTEDKPSLIDSTSLDNPNKKFSQSAAQTISFVRNLPMLIGDKIPEDDGNWYSVLVLIKICQISLSPIVSYDTIPHLRLLIQEKLQLLKTLYPGSTMKPKMHYMVHYPSQIERHGPLIHSWTMRHEAKLSFMKRASRRGNFKNILKTVVKHHQLWLCYQLNCESHLLCPSPQLSPKEKKSCLSTETDAIKSQILSVTPSLSLTSSLKHHKWCKVQSLVYKVGSYVLIQRDDMTPKFGKIQDVIYVCESHQILFYVEVFEGYSFSIHYNAFVVRSTSNTLVLDVSSIQDHHSLLVRKSFDVSDHNLYVAMPSVY